MKPTQGDVHVSRPLSSILIAYMQGAEKFIAKEAFPIVSVQSKTDSYYKWDRDDFFRVSAAERAPGAPSEGGGFTLSTDTYNCKEYAIHKDIEDAVLANADAELDLEGAASEYIAHQLLLKRESVWAAAAFAASVWTGGTGTATDQAGVSGSPGANEFKQWNDSASTPIEDIREQMMSIEKKTGYRPNVLILGPEVWNAVEDHPDLLDRIKYTQAGVVTTQLLAGLLGLDKVLIGRASKNTAVEGQTASYSFFHGKSALLLYRPSKPSIMAPSAGYTFAWSRRFGAGAEGQRVKRFYMQDRGAMRVEGEMAFAVKIVATELGCFFATAVA